MSDHSNVAPKPDYQKPVVQPAAQPVAQPVFQPRPAAVPSSSASQSIVTSEIERLLVSSDRLLKSQLERIVTEEAAYETARTQMMNDYNAKVAKLDHDTKEALFRLGVGHEQTIAEIKRFIAKLNALREA